jgi:hypothetical protein
VWDEEVRDGHYALGDEKIRFIYGLTSMSSGSPDSESQWPRIAEYADPLDSQPHKMGDAYFYIMLEPNSLLVLKWTNIDRNYRS